MKRLADLFRFSILKSITKAILISISAVVPPLTGIAQFQEGFEDGNFTAAPPWSGSSGSFQISSSGQLQLNGSGVSAAYLSAATSLTDFDEVEWRGYVRLDFSPSSNNYARYYLSSDQPDLSGALNGYYLQFGESGPNDAISIVRQSGTTHTIVCRGTDASISSAFGVRVKVLRDALGTWKLFVDHTGGSDFVLEATGLDSAHPGVTFLGVSCAFTASNATRFFFDDFYCGAMMVDAQPPRIKDVTVVDAHRIDISFDERMDRVSAETVSNYQLRNAFPLSATLLSNERGIRLTFSERISILADAEFRCTVTVRNLKDLAGNVMTDSEQSFYCFEKIAPISKDVIITEIFPDPDPSSGLPPAEFIEILNNSNKPFDLQDWTIGDDRSVARMFSHVLLPGNYVILTASADVSSLAGYGVVLGLSGFPSLNNDGDILILKNDLGATVDSVNYSDDWYKDAEKKNGGWSLEIIDPDNSCAEETNWIASDDDEGGTPGKQNSVFEKKPDLTGPTLISVTPVSEYQLFIRFDEKLEAALPPASAFVFTPSLTFTDVSFASQDRRTIVLTLGSALEKGTAYTLNLAGVYDCAGNAIQEDHARVDFALPEPAVAGDLIVNEILFDPRATGVDFVEVYNTSDKFINLKNWSLSNRDSAVAENGETISSDDFLLRPHDYAVFTENGNVLKGEYVQAVEKCFVEVKDMPAFNNDYGYAALLDDKGNVIDAVAYAAAMHSPFIKDVDGVSLERIRIIADPETSNWQSASSRSGFATPGYINSSAISGQLLNENAVHVEPRVFEPTTGNPGTAEIRYAFDAGGFSANVKILDAEGREIRALANNEFLGTHGSISWDGRMNDGRSTRAGYYVVWFQIFNASGYVETFRKSVAVMGK